MDLLGFCLLLVKVPISKVVVFGKFRKFGKVQLL